MASELFKEASKYFSLDSLDKDNWAFKLFSKITVGIFMGSAALSLASSYSGDAIVCKGGDDYDKQYCWLHGSRQLPASQISDDISGKHCYADPDNEDVSLRSPNPDTEYYIWVSMVLFLNGIVFMIPDKLWQYFEDGMLEQFGSDKSNFLSNPRDEYDADGKHVAVFKMISKKLSRKYFWTFVACEMLNVVIGIVSFLCINAFLSGQFSTYGADVLNYSSGYKEGKKDPMCSLFPTIVNCETSFFGVTGAKDVKSKICILGQNILNQKIYFLLWLWFMVLFGVSVLVIINRIMCIFVPAFQRQVVAAHLKSKNANRLTSIERIPLGHDYLGKWFLLAQLGRNSCPYKYRNFLEKLGEKQPLLDGKA